MSASTFPTRSAASALHLTYAGSLTASVVMHLCAYLLPGPSRAAPESAQVRYRVGLEAVELAAAPEQPAAAPVALSLPPVSLPPQRPRPSAGAPRHPKAGPILPDALALPPVPPPQRRAVSDPGRPIAHRTPNCTPRPLAKHTTCPEAPGPYRPSRPATAASSTAGVKRPAALTAAIQPRYPRAARLRHQEGMVIIELQVDRRGCPRAPRVVEPSGYALLDQAALQAAARSRFDPARQGGHPITSTHRLRFCFSLRDGP